MFGDYLTWIELSTRWRQLCFCNTALYYNVWCWELRRWLWWSQKVLRASIQLGISHDLVRLHSSFKVYCFSIRRWESQEVQCLLQRHACSSKDFTKEWYLFEAMRPTSNAVIMLTAWAKKCLRSDKDVVSFTKGFQAKWLNKATPRVQNKQREKENWWCWWCFIFSLG